VTKQKLSVLKFFILGIFLVLVGIFIFLKNREIIQIASPPSPSPVSTLGGSMTPNTIEGRVTYVKVSRVIDGDTIVIDTGQRVRYIGMNTPEIETSECYATEASEINKNLVLGKTVKLEKDVSETDKYGRLLRYVYVGDIFIDDELVKEGAAKIMTVPPDIEYKDEFLQSQNYAKENNLGLWSKCQN
jgi:micrococcal nuclease